MEIVAIEAQTFDRMLQRLKDMAHTRKRGTRSENKENVNNADWRELKSYTSHEVRIFLTANLSGIVLSSSVSLQK